MRAARWAERRRHSMDRPGTSEASWRGWPALREFPAVHLAGITSAVVIAAHPGDAVLSVGGTISMLAASGARVRMVSASTGDVADSGKRGTPWEWWGEVRHALQMLGADGVEIVQLRDSDGHGGGGGEPQAETLTRLCAGFD
ncbi:MAG UNVERIFIED_CONTAM: PIG-L family deacetylase, partial [Thermobifida fusca]